MGEELSARAIRHRRMLPDALTLARPVLGIASGLAVATGDPVLGGWLYLAAYVTDVLDGLAARVLRVSSDHGRRLDGVADIVSMVAVGIGLAIGGARAGTWGVVAVVVVTTVGGHLVDRLVVSAHTVVGKAIGGATRLGAWVLFVYLAEPADRAPLAWAGAALFGVTYAYEALVTLDDLRSGERPVR